MQELALVPNSVQLESQQTPQLSIRDQNWSFCQTCVIWQWQEKWCISWWGASFAFICLRQKHNLLQFKARHVVELSVGFVSVSIFVFVIVIVFILKLVQHSCEIGNAPILDANNQYFIFPVSLWYFWYYFVSTYTKKVRGQLEKCLSEYFTKQSDICVPT